MIFIVIFYNSKYHFFYMAKKLTTEEFKTQLLKEHPELELLSDYNGNKNYITVRCVKHNHVFKTKPNWLHAGIGCQKCYDERRGATTRKTLDYFINESIKIHGNKYDYSKVKYVNSTTKVCIICPEHGEFWQTPNHHLRGQGCPKCSGRNKTTESVIKEFKKIHGNDYIYDKVEYVNNSTKVLIICPIHGEFWQTPDKHLQGEGCPVCKSSKLERKVRNFLLENKIEFIRQAKFDWLGKQSLDFYLPDYNLAIECQGEQHFKEFTGGFEPKTNIDKRIRLDIMKKELCDENSIKMLYVMQKRWKTKSFQKKFNNIYNEKNVVLEKELDKISEALE